MQLKELLIIAGYLVMFLMYYLFGWFCDKNFRLYMRKTKLPPYKKIFFHFRGTKLKENRGHALICVKFQIVAFINILIGAICTIAVKVTNGQMMVFLASGALLAASFGVFAFKVYENICKYNDRKKQDELRDETGLEDYDKISSVPVSEIPQQPIPNQVVRAPINTDDGDKTKSMAIGKEILKNKGLLDDDTFMPFSSNVADTFKDGTRMAAELSEADDIKRGKEALKDYAGKQLSTEGFNYVNNFEEHKNAYGKVKEKSEKSEETGRSIADIINEHKQEINPENKFKSVNKYTSVSRKDSNQ